MSERPAWVADALAVAPVARLATVGADGSVHLVPFCFAVVDERLVSAVDHKPKRHTRLQRLADIAATGRASVLVDHYDDDWTQLWWIRVGGAAAAEPAGARSTGGRGRRWRRSTTSTGRSRRAGPVWWVALDAVQWWRP